MVSNEKAKLVFLSKQNAHANYFQPLLGLHNVVLPEGCIGDVKFE